MPYWRLHYHLIWCTYKRMPMITEGLERAIHGTILSKADELGVVVHAIGNIEDHIHVAASIPPRLSVADCLKHFKGSSSRYVNSQVDATANFSWQEGYGALTFGERAMADVVEYVLRQKEHHSENTLRTPFERMDAEEDGVKNAVRLNARLSR